MIIKKTICCLFFCYFLAATLSLAQDKTLADIKAQLPVLLLEIKSLELELKSNSNAVDGFSFKGNYEDRLDSIEKELTSIISQVENLQHRIDKIIKDGTNRLSDIHFRLCEIEQDCDISSLSKDILLGEGLLTEIKNDKVFLEAPLGELTIFEKRELKSIRKLIEAGDNINAIEKSKFLLSTYPQSVSSFEVKAILGKALKLTENWKEAAAVYLDIYSSHPKSNWAAEALYNLGLSFSKLDQYEDACLMLTQLQIEYPQSNFEKVAVKKITELNCQ